MLTIRAISTNFIPKEFWHIKHLKKIYIFFVFEGSKNVIECIAESFAHVGNAMCVKFSPKVSFFPNF